MKPTYSLHRFKKLRPNLREEFDRALEKVAQIEEIEDIEFERQLGGHSKPNVHEIFELKGETGREQVGPSRVMRLYIYTRDSRVGRGIGCIVKLFYRNKSQEPKIKEGVRKITRQEIYPIYLSTMLN